MMFAGFAAGSSGDAVFARYAQAYANGSTGSPRRAAIVTTSGVSTRIVASFDSVIVTRIASALTSRSRTSRRPNAARDASEVRRSTSPLSSAAPAMTISPKKKRKTSACDASAAAASAGEISPSARMSTAPPVAYTHSLRPRGRARMPPTARTRMGTAITR
jgi:hypothetical protein